DPVADRAAASVPNVDPTGRQRDHRDVQELRGGRRLWRRAGSLRSRRAADERPGLRRTADLDRRGGRLPAHHAALRCDPRAARTEGGDPAMSDYAVLYDAPGPRARRRSLIGGVIATIVILAAVA